jgi:hypothetical protein
LVSRRAYGLGTFGFGHSVACISYGYIMVDIWTLASGFSFVFNMVMALYAGTLDKVGISFVGGQDKQADIDRTYQAKTYLRIFFWCTSQTI